MSIETYDCAKCGASFGIAGENSGSYDDVAADYFFGKQIEWHESGQCVPAAVEPEPVKPDPRTEYIAGLHALAAWLTEHPEVPLPYGAGTSDLFDSEKVTFYLRTREQMRTFARLFPGRLDKRTWERRDGDGGRMELHGHLAGLHLYASVERDEVCERIVTGTRQVTEEVPDPAAPKITVTRTVEDVEWRCMPLLAEDREPETVPA